jgi:hypothetical protein
LLLLISYDSTTADRPQKFEALDGAIRGLAQEVLRPLHSGWFVQTDDDVEVWGNRLKEHLAPEDRLVIVRIHGAASVNGWLTPAQWQWIRDRAT